MINSHSRYNPPATTVNLSPLQFDDPKLVETVRLALARANVAPERLEPAYLRNQVALTLVEQQALRDSRR